MFHYSLGTVLIVAVATNIDCQIGCGRCAVQHSVSSSCSATGASFPTDATRCFDASGVVGFASSPQRQSQDGAPAGCFISDGDDGPAVVFNDQDMSGNASISANLTAVCVTEDCPTVEPTAS